MLPPEVAMTDEYRDVYERILYASYLTEDFRHTRSIDTFLAWMPYPGLTKTTAYVQFDLLRGRSAEFRNFARRTLGYPDDAAARADLDAKYGPMIQERLNQFRTRGR